MRTQNNAIDPASPARHNPAIAMPDGDIMRLEKPTGWPIADLEIEPTRLSFSKIAGVAVDVRETFGFDPRDQSMRLHDKIIEFGGRIEWVGRWSSGYDKLIRVTGERDYTIYLLRDSDCAERRFDMARALGHFSLHYAKLHKGGRFGGFEPFAASRFHQNELAGREAVYFALEFLLPYDEMKKAAKKFAGGSAETDDLVIFATGIANTYRVPGLMVYERLKSFLDASKKTAA